MKNIYSFAICAAIAACAASPMSAEDKLVINPTGRILMDGALYVSPDHDQFRDGAAIPDARLGAKVSYGNWRAKLDIGFAYGQVGLKDLWMAYDFNENSSIQIGSFIHQYGLQSATSSSMKETFEEPVSNGIFNDSRQIGVMYKYSVPSYLGTISANVDPSSNKLILKQNETEEGYGFRTRQVWRPIHDDGLVLQVGISGAFATPRHHEGDSRDDSFSFNANFPTRVDQVGALSANVDRARNQFKFTPELLLNYGPVALESQYFFNQVNRLDGLHRYNAYGAYVEVRGLVLGGDYAYSMGDGGLATPRPHSLEVVGMFNYTNTTDLKAGIYGGRMNNFSLTASYHINKYMLCRLNYTYSHTWDGSPLPTTLNAIQARLQVIF